MCQAYGKLFRQELGGAEEGAYNITQLAEDVSIFPYLRPTCRRSFTKLHHLPQTHSSSRKARVVFDGVHQPLGLLPRHADYSGLSAWSLYW